MPGVELPQLNWVWDVYADARAAFLAAAAAANATCYRWELPDHLGRHGETLSCDAVFVGKSSASRLLLNLSGLHGLEGPAGSAIQTQWLAAGPGLPDDVAALIVHAINPWGFSHRSRGTEDNVDLNRSFIDRRQPPPANPDYAALHPALCPPAIDDASIEQARLAVEAFERQYGAERANSAIGMGQYDYADGLYYGGTDEPWSVGVLRDALARHPAASAVQEVALVDLHTGRGDFGEPFFLCFDPPGSRPFERAAQWWGRDRLLDRDELGSKYESDAPPPRSGLGFHGIRAIVEPAAMAGAVVEFGTYGLWEMYAAELTDRWVRFHGDPGDAETQRLRDNAFRAFTPDSDRWRRQVLTAGRQILDQTVAGLANR